MYAESQSNNRETLNNKGSNIWCVRGDVFYADLGRINPNEPDCEQKGIRPVVIIQNNIGNKHAPTVIVAIITSQIDKAKLPTHIELKAGTYGLTKDSVVTFEQIRTLDKRKLKSKVGHLSRTDIMKVNRATKISLALDDEEDQTIYLDDINTIKTKAAEIRMLDSFIQTCLDEYKTLDNPITMSVLNRRKEHIDFLASMCSNKGLKVENFYDVKVEVNNNECWGVCS